MSVKEIESAAVLSGATGVAMSQFFSLGAAGANAPYIVLTALDRNEYTATASGDTGSFSGGGAALGLSATGGDGRSCGIVFTWQAATGQYVNAIYGSLAQLVYTASDSAGDVTNLSLFGTANYALAQLDAGNAYAMMQDDPAGYIGSVTIATEPGYTEVVPLAATPDGVAAAAMAFVGKAWNQDGCWVLASTIAAEAGASLPVQSTAIGIPGRANGEWVVVYNGPASAGANWRGLVATGDIVAFGTPGGGGHITTCVSGSGATAMLVDNIVYENAAGAITNLAHDGAAADIVISPPHAAAQEWNGVNASSVVIYALDTPVLADAAPGARLAAGKSLGVASLFTATDPAHRGVTAYQVYSVGAASLMVRGVAEPAHSAVTAVTLSSLNSASLLAGGAGADTVEARAFNGVYWGDWQGAVVTVSPPQAAPPVLSAHTANQVWQPGTHVELILPASLFVDPQHETLTYAAKLSDGAALPQWLRFAPAQLTFSGTVPAGAASFGLTVTATDSSGLAAAETFSVTVAGAATSIAVGDWIGLAPAEPSSAPGAAAAGGRPTQDYAAPDATLLMHHHLMAA